MSRSKDWRQYSKHYRNILTYLSKPEHETEHVVIPFPNMASANSFRLDFNSFKTALSSDPAARGMFGIASEIMVQVMKEHPQHETPVAAISNRNYSEASIAIAKALIAKDPEWSAAHDVKLPDKLPTDASMYQVNKSEDENFVDPARTVAYPSRAKKGDSDE